MPEEAMKLLISQEESEDTADERPLIKRKLNPNVTCARMSIEVEELLSLNLNITHTILHDFKKLNEAGDESVCEKLRVIKQELTRLNGTLLACIRIDNEPSVDSPSETTDPIVGKEDKANRKKT